MHQIHMASRFCISLVILHSSPMRSSSSIRGDTGYICSMPSSSVLVIRWRWVVNNSPPMDSAYVAICQLMGISVKLMLMGASQQASGLRESSGPNEEEELDGEEGMSIMGGT